jgi:hypothetical protein
MPEAAAMWDLSRTLSGVSVGTAHVESATTTMSAVSDDEGGVSTTNEGSTGHEMVDRTLSMVDGGFSVNCKDACFICGPYKDEVFKRQIADTDPGSTRRTAIISTLQDLGVKVFIIDSVSTPTAGDVLHHVRRVVAYISRENRTAEGSCRPLGYQRCLLYQDDQGRLFNLLLSEHATGLSAKWKEYLDGFSGLWAMIALSVLARSFPCVGDCK